MALRGSYMALDFSTAAAVFMFFVVVGIVNTVLGILRRSWALTGPELATVYIMMIVATSIPTMGLTEYLLPIITGGFYYATPENDWANLIHPYISDWMYPQSQEAVKYFYEGMPRGASIPWGVWMKPLFYWTLLILALYFVMICMMVILRKQWVEKERLIFPLTQLPTAMIEEGERSSVLKPFFKNPLMWTGFLIPLIIGSIRALHNYYNFIPTIALQTSVPIFRRMTTLQIALSFPMVGFSYFINLDIAFGIWFFNLLAKIQEGSFAILGIESLEKLDYTSGSPILAHQGMGAMIVLVVLGLWIARRHIWDVLRKAFRGDADVDDSGEMLSYRTAVFGTIGGMLFMSIWLWFSGMPGWAIPIFLCIAFLLFIAITRIVAEGTLVFPQQVARIDRQVRQPVRGSVEEALNRHLRRLIPQVDAVLVSDYKSGVVTPPLLDTARSQARRLHKLITADSQGDLHNFAGFDVVKSNRRETERTLGRSLEKEADFRWAGEHLLGELGAQAVLITRGGEGMSLASREEGYLHIPAANRSEVFDVTGAGDTVIAVLTLALAAGATVLQAAHLANHAAGLVVRRLGNVAPTPEELAWAIENW